MMDKAKAKHLGLLSAATVPVVVIRETLSDSQRIDYLESQLRDLKRALRDGLLHTVRWVEKNGSE